MTVVLKVLEHTQMCRCVAYASNVAVLLGKTLAIHKQNVPDLQPVSQGYFGLAAWYS